MERSRTGYDDLKASLNCIADMADLLIAKNRGEIPADEADEKIRKIEKKAWDLANKAVERRAVATEMKGKSNG